MQIFPGKNRDTVFIEWNWNNWFNVITLDTHFEMTVYKCRQNTSRPVFITFHRTHQWYSNWMFIYFSCHAVVTLSQDLFFFIDIEQCLTQKPYECVTESLRGARVLVTGASTGIGEQMAYHYAHFGAQIVITARRGKVLQQVSESVNIYKPMFYPVAEQLCICICKVLWKSGYWLITNFL